jgi:hypothetical protein
MAFDDVSDSCREDRAVGEELGKREPQLLLVQ